jgi:uncharacterized protein (TIGR03067 family)
MNVLLLLTTGALAFAAPAPDPEKLESVEQKIQGVWILKSREVDGKAENIRVGDKLKIGTAKIEPPPPESAYSYKLGTKGRIGTIDITQDGGPLKDQTILGIYSLKGDTLTLCITMQPNANRPVAFDSSGGQVLIIFTRQKP